MILGALLLAATTFFSNGPHGGRAAALAAAPSDPRVLYAGTGAGVLRSNDGGVTWVRTARGVENVTRLAVDPADPNMVYAVATLHEYSGRVFKSSDAGASWAQLPLPAGISPVALLVPEHDVVYVGSECQQYFSRGPEPQFHEAAGIFKSIDGGQTWAIPNSGELGTICITDMTFDPLNRSHMIARVIYNNVARESFDGGVTWRAATEVTPSSRIVAHPTDPSIRYGISAHSLAVSEDAGVTWTRIEPVNVTATEYLSLEIDPSTGRLFLGTDRGVYRSGDGGRSWLPISTVPSTRVEGVVVDSSTRTIVTGTAFGIYTSDFPYGASEPVPVADLATLVTRVVVQPGDPRRLFAATTAAPFGPLPFPGRIYRSSDRGLTWEPIEDPNPESRSLIAVDAAGDLYAASRFANALYRLPRDGNAFERLPQTFESITDVVADPVRPGVVYVLTTVTSFETRDRARTWQRTRFSATSTRWLAIDPTNPDTLYGAVPGGAFKAEAGLPVIGLNAPNIAGPIAVSPVKPSTLYAVFETAPFSGKNLIGRSDDAGKRWQIVPSPWGEDVITALAADPRDASTVWIATGRRGLLVSRDGGNNWSDANANLPTWLIFSIVFDDRGQAMHVGTNRGVWTMPLVSGRRRAAAK